MYKSKFKFLGQTGLILILGLLIPILTVGLLINFIKTGQNQNAIIFVVPLLIFSLTLLWSKILTEMNQVEITESTIQIKNPLTKRIKKIDKQKIEGFKDTFKNGYTILIIDTNGKIVAKIYNYYYQDFNSLRDNLGVKYIERIPSFWDKIIKIEAKE